MNCSPTDAHNSERFVMFQSFPLFVRILSTSVNSRVQVMSGSLDTGGVGGCTDFYLFVYLGHIFLLLIFMK